MKTKEVLKKLKSLPIEQQARVACLASASAAATAAATADTDAVRATADAYDVVAAAAAYAVDHAIKAGVKKSFIIKLIEEERGQGEIDLDEYETEPIDYTGCHPVIAESLRRGKGIDCFFDYTREKTGRVIAFYSTRRGCKYMTSDGKWYEHAQPILKNNI